MSTAGSLAPRHSVHGRDDMEQLFNDTILFFDKGDYSQTQDERRQTLRNMRGMVSVPKLGTLRSFRSPPGNFASPRANFTSPRSNGYPLFADFASGTLHTASSMAHRSHNDPIDRRPTSLPSWKAMYGHQSHGQQQHTLMASDDANIDLTAPLPRPYDGAYISINALKFRLNSCLAKNPRV